jgi:hypothetical protein
LPVPDAPELIVTKAALLVAVHEQLEAAVTGMVPVVAEPETLVCTLPTVTAQEDDGDESLFEHAATANAAAAETRRASTSRWSFIGGVF